MHVTRHRAIVVVLSDFLGQTRPTRAEMRRTSAAARSSPLAQTSFTTLRQTNRRHDVVAVQIVDRFEQELPALGYLILKDGNG